MYELLTIEEAAALMRLPVSSLRWLRYDGRGPKAAKIGRRVMYRRADVDAWIAEQFDGAA